MRLPPFDTTKSRIRSPVEPEGPPNNHSVLPTGTPNNHSVAPTGPPNLPEPTTSSAHQLPLTAQRPPPVASARDHHQLPSVEPTVNRVYQLPLIVQRPPPAVLASDHYQIPLSHRFTAGPALQVRWAEIEPIPPP